MAVLKELEGAAKGKRQPARAKTNTCKGVHAPISSRIPDPVQTALQKATWTTERASHKGDAGPAKIAAQPSKVAHKIGDKIEPKYKNSGHTWYTGTVLGINANGTYDIDYDHGDYDANVPAR